jgi:hypothetical protein
MLGSVERYHMKIVAVHTTASIGALPHWSVGDNGVTKIEEVMLAGPNGPMPYIRVHVDTGYTIDCPKHNLVSIAYEP